MQSVHAQRPKGAVAGPLHEQSTAADLSVVVARGFRFPSVDKAAIPARGLQKNRRNVVAPLPLLFTCVGSCLASSLCTCAPTNIHTLCAASATDFIQ